MKSRYIIKFKYIDIELSLVYHPLFDGSIYSYYNDLYNPNSNYVISIQRDDLINNEVVNTETLNKCKLITNGK